MKGEKKSTSTDSLLEEDIKHFIANIKFQKMSASVYTLLLEENELILK